MTYNELLEYALQRSDADRSDSVFQADCEIAAYCLCNAEIKIPEGNRYFIFEDASVSRAVMHRRRDALGNLSEQNGLAEGESCRAYTGDLDFGHTSPDWEAVMSLGIYGLYCRIASYEASASDEKRPFYTGLKKVYRAALSYIARVSEAARSAGKEEMANSLAALTERAPKSFYEALQTTLIYYVLQMQFDATILRTMGRLDSLLKPFAEGESDETIGKMLDDYMRELNAFQVRANIPFAIGGRKASGEDATSRLSYAILNSYLRTDTAYVKMHILVAESTPRELLLSAFKGVCDGKNSLVFLSDEKIVEGLERLGAAHADAMAYHVVGCYESGARDEVTCSCNARLNLPKALELALCGGQDMLTGAEIGLGNGGGFASFDELFEEFLRQMRHLAECAMETTTLYEKNYRRLHAAPILSATYTSALESGRDLYCDSGARYNNSSLNALGIATVVDSLAAIRELVYEKGALTLDRFVEILRSDWQGSEALRLYIKNKCPKYGTGDEGADALAQRIVSALGDCINGKPNTRGGVWRLGLFSIDWRWEFGKRTAASADGRHSGETLSQNTSAAFGADRNGITAHLRSAASLDTVLTPNGAIVDIDLHCSAAEPEMLSATLRTYFALGGFGVHYNVLNTEILREARELPEKHPNLQVRLCGWNALFANLSDKEKDEFIARSSR